MIMRMTGYASLLVALGVLLHGCEMFPEPDRPAQQERDAQAVQFLEEADDYLDQGLLDAALASFGLALERNPRLTEAHMGMGNVYRELGDFEKASGAFERAVQTNPNSVDAHYSLGLMRHLMGRFSDAIASYLRALTIDPNSFDANRDLAAAYLQINRPNDALPYAQRAVQLDPDDQGAWANLAATFSLAERYSEAVDAYRQAAEAGAPTAPVMLGLADAHIRLGNYELAINVLRTAVHQSPSATAHERLGFALFRLRRIDDALVQYRQALTFDERDTSALNGVGACLMTQYIQGGRENMQLRDEALASWRKSVQIKPDQSRIVDLISRYGRL